MREVLCPKQIWKTGVALAMASDAGKCFRKYQSRRVSSLPTPPFSRSALILRRDTAASGRLENMPEFSNARAKSVYTESPHFTLSEKERSHNGTCRQFSGILWPLRFEVRMMGQLRTRLRGLRSPKVKQESSETVSPSFASESQRSM